MIDCLINVNIDTIQPEGAEELKQTISSSASLPQLDQSQSKQKLFFGVIPEERMVLYTVLVLVIAPPIGTILIWFGTRWPLWIKVLISSIILAPLAFFMLVASQLS